MQQLIVLRDEQFLVMFTADGTKRAPERTMMASKEGAPVKFPPIGGHPSAGGEQKHRTEDSRNHRQESLPMQFQHRSHSLIKRQHSSHIGRPLPLPSTSTRPRNTKGHNGSPGRPNTLMKAMQVETVPVRAHAYTSIHTQLPACNFVGLRNTHVPATQAVDTDPDCDWETWLEAGGDLLMGQPT